VDPRADHPSLRGRIQPRLGQRRRQAAVRALVVKRALTLRPVEGYDLAACLCVGCETKNVRFCRVAGLDWRLGRVYFLAFLNPSRGQPDPALTARLASPANVDEATTELD
jgi:hypothetical protein